MILRILSLTSLALVTAVFTSCGNSGLAVIPKTSIGGSSSPVSVAATVKKENFNTPACSTSAVAAAVGKPRDKHSMPVYAFSDRNRIVRTTAYTCSECDHLIYGNKNAAGTVLRYTDTVRSAAADWSFYPVGTTFRIKGLPYLYVIDDYGSALVGTGTVDLYKPSKAVMNQWGRRTVEITIVQWGSFTRSAQILSGRTQFAHCNQMFTNIIRQRPDLGSLASR